MSTKSKLGTLYFNGQKMMDELTDVVVVEDTASEKEMPSLKTLQSDEISFTVDNAYISQRFLLSLIMGRHISNNWLKMHGGIMERKVCRRK